MSFFMSKIVNNRLFLLDIPFEKDRGIACYSKCVGVFLSCFGVATRYKRGNQVYYVNTKSFKRYQHLTAVSLTGENVIFPPKKITNHSLGSRPISSKENPLFSPPPPNKQNASSSPQETKVSFSGIRATLPERKLPLHDKISHSPLTEVIEAANTMPLNNFKAEVGESFFSLKLGTSPEKVQPLYLGLNEKQREELLEALLKSPYSHTFQEITKVWTKEEALKALEKFRNNKDHLLQLCYANGKRESLNALLSAMTLEEFKTVCSEKTGNQIFIFLTHCEEPHVVEGEAKALFFLESSGPLRNLTPYLEKLSPNIKAKWIEHLKKSAPKEYFHELGYQESQAFAFVKEYLETMSEEEIRTFAKTNPFNLESGWVLGTKIFTYLITHLEEKKASRFVLGLWENEHIDTRFRINGLAQIYSTLKNSERPEVYSPQLQNCLSAVFYWLGSSGKWDNFLEDDILDWRDGINGNNNQAFAALLTLAVIMGIKHSKARPLLTPLFAKHEHYLIAYKILGGGIQNPNLVAGLTPEEKKELIALANTSHVLKGKVNFA